MGKITDIPKRLKASFTKQTDLLLLLELAVVMLIASIAANYIYNYISELLSSSGSVKSWEYVYTDSPTVQSGTEWETANSIIPLSKEKTGEYLHLRSSFDGHKEEQTLIIKADYAPMIISVNGETVYNNHYGESSYVGNIYNAVVIPAANGKIPVEISVFLPFSAGVETYIANGSAEVAFSAASRLIFTGILLLLGVAAFFAAIIFGILGKKSSYIFAVSGHITVYGLATGVYTVSRGSYLLNFAGFYNISIALEFLVIAMFTVTAASVLRTKDKKFIFCLCLSILPIAVILLAPSALILQIASLAATALSFIAVALLLKKCKELLITRIQYSKSIYLMLSFLALFDLFSGIMQATLRYRVDFAVARLVGELIFLCYIVFVLTAKALSKNSQKDVFQKTDLYNDCITKITGFMSELLSLGSDTEICKVAAEVISELCRDMNIRTNTTAYAVFKKENGENREVCKTLLDQRVNCAVIENRCIDSENHYFFTETYFDLVFFKNDRVYIIFHFENLKNALSPFFTAVITMFYSGIEIALARLSRGNTEQAEFDIFTKLAYKTEAASNSNPDHLEIVASYTNFLMEAMGYPENVRAAVAKAAMLHDIGKIAIPSEITNKTGLLSERERDIIKKHTEYGKMLLSVFNSEFMNLAAVIANEHHERYDGKGYNGFKGERINEYARVVTVADVIDALNSKRSYKEAWTLEQVIDYIDSNSGTLYDPKVVAAMHKCIDKIRHIVTEKE